MFILIFLLVLSLLPATIPARSASTTVVISELQTESSLSALEEFVELYNRTDAPVSLEGWTIEYRSASGASWSKKATLTGTIAPYSFYLVAPTTYLPTRDAELSTGMSGSAGHMRLLDATKQPIDLLGWGSANGAETEAMEAHPSGKSLERLPGFLVPEGGNGWDSDHNAEDFRINASPQPQSKLSSAELAYEGELPEPPIDTTEYDLITITELFVDPVSPQTDSQDEFVELYNPGDTPVHLAGYVVKTGDSFSYSFELPDMVIEPHGYETIYVVHSGLVLSNSGGAAQLLDPSGKVIYETPHYTKAPPGQSWGWFESGWAWSTQVSPRLANVMVVPPPKPAKTVSIKKPRTSRKVAAKRTPRATTKRSVPIVASASDPGSGVVSVWLLAALAAITMVYGLYELRYDIHNYYQLSRRYLRRRR